MRRAGDSHRSHVKFQGDRLGQDEHQQIHIYKTDHEKIITTSDGFHFPRTEKVITSHEGPPHTPNLQKLFAQKANKGAEEKVFIETTTTEKTYKADIDVEAGEFIKRKHRSLELQKLMSTRAA